MVIMGRRIIIFATLVISATLNAFVFDNRFFPSVRHSYVTVYDRPSHAAAHAFFATASGTLQRKEGKEQIPDLFGSYDQFDIIKALDALGKENPLDSQLSLNLSAAELPWDIEGKIQAQGALFSCQHQITDWLSIGFYVPILRVNTTHSFAFKNEGVLLTKDELNNLDKFRLKMHNSLGLCSDHWSAAGMGDMDLYVRFNKIWDYLYKFRSIDAGFSLGVLAPTGVSRDISAASSVPFGGDGHWGFYGSGDAEFELKEDWKLGLDFRVSKRFSHTKTRRAPIGNEPLIFGGVVGGFKVEPGVTFNFGSHLTFENLREGLGMRVAYTLTVHGKDSWTDVRPNKCVPVKLTCVRTTSDWASDYFTLTVFYDFGKVKAHRDLDPIVRLSWDIPSGFVLTHDVSKTHMVSIGFEINF